MIWLWMEMGWMDGRQGWLSIFFSFLLLLLHRAEWIKGSWQPVMDKM
jgi:hypothetical protein